LRDTYTALEGLPQNSVESLTRTSDGYIWAATQDGLARFDGVRFQTFQAQNSPGLPQDNIHFVTGARDGSLWVGTYSRGVAHLSHGTFVPVAGLLSPVIRSILEDRNNVVWIGTRAGLNRWKNGKLSAYTTAEGLASNEVVAMVEDRQGRLWIGTNGGLSLLQGGSFAAFAAQNQLAGAEVRSLALARDGSLWAVAGQAVVHLKEGAAVDWYGPEQLPVKNSIQALAAGPDGELWIGTFGEGLLRLRDGRFERYGTEQGLSSGVIISLLCGENGTLWVGTSGGGLNRLRPRRIRMIGAPEGLSDNAADAVFEARDGALWIGTLGHGLNRYQGGRMRTYTVRDGLSSDVVLSVWQSERSGRLWVGTEDGAVNWLQGERFHHLSLGARRRPAQIFEERDGVVWVGSTNGLFRFENGAPAKMYTSSDGLPSNTILAVTQAHDGSLWLGTGSGLSHFQAGRFTNYATAQAAGAYGVRVDWIHEDAEGVLWLGSAGSGIGRFKDGQLTWAGTEQGLNDNVAYAILEDGGGDLWISTNRGICRVAKSQLNDLAAGLIRRVVVHVYGVSDGMRSNECNGDTQPSGWKGQNGELLFACVGGVVRIDPLQLPRETAPPAVVIEEAQINGKRALWPTGKLRIPPGDGRLEFTYTAIDFAAPQQMSFRYRVEGVDKDWVEAGTRRAAYYTNISPGTYRFYVRAENADSVSNEASLAFVILPHFYQTYWFYSLCGLLACLLAVGMHRLRLKRMRAREAELVLTVAQRTAELQEDIRERQRAEVALRESEQFNREVIANAQEGVTVYDCEFRYRVWNRFMEELTGVPASEALGKHAFDLFPHLREQKLDLLIRRALAGEVVHAPDTPFRVPTTGKSGWVSAVYSPHFGARGEIIGVIGAIRDITKHKRAEELVQEGRKELQTIIDSVPALVFYKDKTNRLLRVNRTFSEAMGMPKKEMENRTCSELWPETGEGYWSDDREVIESRCPKRNIIETVNTAQGTRWLQTDKIPHLDEGGNVVGIIGFAVDITDRKQAEAALIEERHLLHTLMDNLPDTIYFKDRESRFTRINKALAKSFGLSDPAQAVGKTDSDFFTGEHAQQAYADEQEIIRTGRPMLAKEEKETWPDGRETWASTTKMPLRDAHGNILGTFGVSRDITARRRAERALEERTAYLNTLIEISPLGIITLDAQSRVQMCNPAFERLFLYRRAEIEGVNLDELLAPPESVSEALELTSQSLNGIAVHTTSRRRRKDGTLIDVEVHGVPLVMHGALVGQLGLYHDITERKRAEQALLLSEEKFAKAFRSSPNAMAISTLEEGRFLEVNDSFLRRFGRQREDVVGRTAHELGVWVNPDDRVRMIDELRNTGRVNGREVPLRSRSGQIWVGLFSAETIEVRGVHCLLTAVEDITERKRAEEALQESGRQLAQAMDRALLAHWELNTATRIFTFNDRFYALYGTTAEREGGYQMSAETYAREFLFPEDMHIVADEIAKGLATTDPDAAWTVEHRIRRRDGEIRHIVVRISAIKNSEGLTIKTRGVNQDITERKRAEEALRESEERFRRFIENVPLGVCRTTPDGRVLMANPALVRMLGYDSWQELASRNLEDVALEAGYPRSAFREQIEREGEVGGFEAAWKRRDGSVMFVRESARAFRADDGRVLYYDSIVEDVTERRRLGEQLRQSQKMEAVGCLAGGVAHDFNNLLTVVTGYSDLLLKRPPATCAGMRAPLEEIKKAAERAASLTRQLLTFSRKQMLQPQILDLNSLLTNVDEMLRRMIGEDIELVTHLPSALGRVKADPGQIDQVIMNLAVNARDAMPQGGRLTLEAANVELDSSYASSHESVLPGHYVMIAMSDTGIGMDAETQAHIFEPFFTTKEVGKGTGLGLATVYGIVKQSGGSIRVYSEPGKGTTFKVYLPRIDQAAEVIAPTNMPVDELSRGSETILLAEDEEAVRSLVRGVLESTGYQVLETKGAHDALEVGERHRKHIHLLLTDVVMPQMSGAELVKHLAPLHPETKVLYMSGYTDHAVVRHGLLDSSTAFLQKPFTPDALALKVREVLDGAARQGT
jgi:PAS domain S-box-containing protein